MLSGSRLLAMSQSSPLVITWCVFNLTPSASLFRVNHCSRDSIAVKKNTLDHKQLGGIGHGGVLLLTGLFILLSYSIKDYLPRGDITHN